MAQNDQVGAEAKLIQMSTVDIVRCVEANESGQEAPAAKKSSGERGNLGSGSWTIVGPPSKIGGEVTLNRIEDRESNDLDLTLSNSGPDREEGYTAYYKQPVRQKT